MCPLSLPFLEILTTIVNLLEIYGVCKGPNLQSTPSANDSKSHTSCQNLQQKDGGKLQDFWS